MKNSSPSPKLEPLERAKRELVINKLEKETSINFSETSLNLIHNLFNSFKENPNIISEITSSLNSKKILERALILYKEDR